MLTKPQIDRISTHINSLLDEFNDIESSRVIDPASTEYDWDIYVSKLVHESVNNIDMSRYFNHIIDSQYVRTFSTDDLFDMLYEMGVDGDDYSVEDHFSSFKQRLMLRLIGDESDEMKTLTVNDVRLLVQHCQFYSSPDLSEVVSAVEEAFKHYIDTEFGLVTFDDFKNNEKVRELIIGYRDYMQTAPTLMDLQLVDFIPFETLEQLVLSNSTSCQIANELVEEATNRAISDGDKDNVSVYLYKLVSQSTDRLGQDRQFVEICRQHMGSLITEIKRGWMMST